MSLPAEVKIDNVPSGDTCRWCKDTARWSTTAYHKYGGWSDLCDRHLAKLLRRLNLRWLHFTLPEPIVRVEADR